MFDWFIIPVHVETGGPGLGLGDFGVAMVGVFDAVPGGVETFLLPCRPRGDLCGSGG